MASKTLHQQYSGYTKAKKQSSICPPPGGLTYLEQIAENHV